MACSWRGAWNQLIRPTVPKTKATPPPAIQTGTGSLTHHPFAKLSPLQATVRAKEDTPSNQRASAPDSPCTRKDFLQRVRLRQELAGRSGKVVTRISGLPSANLDAIASQLRAALGCGAAVEPPDILLSGSLEARASAWLDRAGDLQAIRSVTKVPVPKKAEVQSTEPVPATVEGSGTVRSEIQRGQRVAIVLKADQATGRLTEGVVRDVLTNSNVHPRGIKVRLEDGQVGRVKLILRPLRPELAPTPHPHSLPRAEPK